VAVILVTTHGLSVVRACQSLASRGRPVTRRHPIGPSRTPRDRPRDDDGRHFQTLKVLVVGNREGLVIEVETF
jgi:hypothetical protein